MIQNKVAVLELELAANHESEKKHLQSKMAVLYLRRFSLWAEGLPSR
jgi:hypothetical protein